MTKIYRDLAIHLQCLPDSWKPRLEEKLGLFLNDGLMTGPAEEDRQPRN